jgi:hypothetical protein
LPAVFSPFAQASRADEMVQHVAEGLRGEPDRWAGDFWWMAVVIAVVGLLMAKWILDWWTGRSQARVTRRSLKLLFLGLCRAHGLAWGDRRLLWRLARFQKLDSPGRLFLEPERFDPTLLDPSAPNCLARYQSLRGRLFAGLEVNTSPQRRSAAGVA